MWKSQCGVQTDKTKALVMVNGPKSEVCKKRFDLCNDHLYCSKISKI